MKKSVSSLLLAGAMLLGTVAPMVASADTTGTTTDSITFNQPKAPTTPVDPTKPGTDVPGGGGGTDPTKGGDLKFLFLSNGIDFGTYDNQTTADAAKAKVYTASKIDNANGNTTADSINSDTNLLTEVSDTRGTNAGWSVSVQATALASKDNSLKGAVVNLDGTNAKNTIKSTSETEANIAGNKTAIATDNSSAVLYTAQKGAGMLTTAFQMDPSAITLTDVPANVAAGTYSGALNWSLSDTPAASTDTAK